ncbi:hypothetical protein SBF1_7540001 [Candidatus Desulfosporosinus infrequens]|uniref:Uncharacterized protein n=1 Tax=Candidatus Desulfosporosinus infrequens TaxID=2043169 RepID=A0A2U3LRD9_9FIRM|nr:hypothetical protein SBF1_7540001 [Candidatus Desulfosporosinus infrequens]
MSKTLLTITELKQRLKELSQEELLGLLVETAKSNKDAQAFVSVKLQGEQILPELVEEYKAKIRNEFDPPKGLPKMRIAIIKQAISDMSKIAKGTVWSFELMVYFAETAVQYIHEEGDIFENMGDYFTDSYDKIIQMLNKEKKMNLYDKYKDRLKAIMETKNCDCWGIHDSLQGSYLDLKWLEDDEDWNEEEI